jgi:non-specific serine/threonine protein kinase/serine/threonine-protein kinase
MMTPERWHQIQEKLDIAMALDPGQRAAFLQECGTADPDLREELESLLAQNSSSRDYFKTSAMLSLAEVRPERGSMIGRRLGPYHVTDLLGVGGMGEVYRASRADDEYKQQVAIKFVRASHGFSSVFVRFKNERQILATLNHPNIARLLDGGTTQDSVPYLVMELIDGQPIDEYCDSHKLDITARLNLFVKVCATVQYAHSRLIVHRDLKPGNILVTTEGQPKLLDFGIAKILDQGVFGEGCAATMTMLRVLTPAYASPEQVKGEPITTASDVYSLGVILYELLTGHAPYRVTGGNVDAISHAVLAVEPEKPSSVVRRVETSSQANQKEITPVAVSGVREGTPGKLRKRLSGDLDNIVLMALRKQPERRYASAEQLTGDIRRHLENLPVVARKDTAGYRTAKFITRHKMGVAATVLVGILLVGALAVTLHEVQVAREQRARAERRFNEVRKLANSLIFEVHDNIQDLPGATSVRKLLVERALSYLDSLAQEPGSEASLQRELAVAYDKVGEVQGTPFGGNLGDTGGALHSYRKALTIREALVRANPANVDDALQLAVSQRQVAGIAAYRADPEAVGQAEQALVAAEHVLQVAPQNAAALAEIIADHNMLGGLLDGEADYQRSLMHTRAALPIAEERLQAAPESRPLHSRVAIIEGRMGYELTRLGLRQEAEEHFQRSIQISESLASDPTDVERKRILALMLQWFAQHLLMKGEVRRASVVYHKAAVILEPPLTADPKNALLDFDLANDCAGWGYTLTMLGDSARGLALIERAEKMLEADVARDPAYVETRESLGTVRIWIGDVLARRGATAQALENYEKSLSVLEQLGADTKWARYQSEAGIAHARIGAVLAKMGKSVEAAEEYRRALVIVEPIMTSHPHIVDVQYAAAEIYTDLGKLCEDLASGVHSTRQQQLQSWKDARDWYQRSQGAWRDVANPGATMPSGFACGNPQAVAAMIAKCEAAVASLLKS